MAISWRERFTIFLLFFALGAVWMGVMPLWQGPDEPAHFSYVQYLEYHSLPPTQAVVAPGKDPWQFSPSPAELASINDTDRNAILSNPETPLVITLRERQQALSNVARISREPGANSAGSQNYVAIYPPLYYQPIAWLLRTLHVANVTAQAYGARLVTAVWLGIAGIVWDIIMSFAVRSAPVRLGLTLGIALLVPTFQMLGGVICNDIAADTASLAIFAATLWALKRPERLASGWAAVGYGVLAGLSIWTKEEAYIVLLAAIPFVIYQLWIAIPEIYQRVMWLFKASIPAVIIALPWFLLTWVRYHSLLPPLTYQGLGSDPRTLNWLIHSELLNGSFERNLMIMQTTFGINFPWWTPWHNAMAFYNALTGMWVILIGSGLILGRRRQPWWLCVVLIVVGVFILWVVEWQYNQTTGAGFLQGRYFFFLLGPVSWIAVQGLLRAPGWVRSLLMSIGLGLTVAVLNHTLWRYYHASLVSFLLGKVVMFTPNWVFLVSRVGMIILLLSSLWFGLRMFKSVEKISATDRQ